MFKKIALVKVFFLGWMVVATNSWAINDGVTERTKATCHHFSQGEKRKPTVELSVYRIQPENFGKRVWIKLTDRDTGKPVLLKDLKTVHTEKIHLLIVNESLEDYSHIHPKATRDPGIYEFEWTPKTNGNYRIWADLFPFKTDAQEYATTMLIETNHVAPKIARHAFFENKKDGYLFKLSLDKQGLQVGKTTAGNLMITNQAGKPVNYLEPIMGSYAHIVGFSENLDSVIHVHPLGQEPNQSTDRGGPKLEFQIQPEKKGFIKLYVQVKINGREWFVPFGINVR